MRLRYLAFLLVLVSVSACKGSSEPELGDYTCRVCGEYDPIIQQRNEDAVAARCRTRIAERNGGVTCMVDNVEYQELVLQFGECEEKPPCASDPAEGGTSGLGWDYECHICGGESDVDSAFDSGVENSGCKDADILRGVGDACPGGDRAVVLGFNNCETAPACIDD